MPRPAVTRMVEDYVTLIWKAREWPGDEPTTTELAARLGVTPSTVSANLKKLARDGFLAYEAYGPIALTETGHRIAVEIVRRHRLIETYLVQALGLPWDQVHDEADRLEHAMSDLVLDRIDEVLCHPDADPHGDPIPARDGTIAPPQSVPLRDAREGDRVRVSRVSDRSPEVLRHLDDLRIVIGTALEIDEVNEAAGIVRVRRDGTPVQLSLHTADAIRVTPAR